MYSKASEKTAKNQPLQLRYEPRTELPSAQPSPAPPRQSRPHGKGSRFTAPRSPGRPLKSLICFFYNVSNFIFICTCLSNTYQFCAVFHNKWALQLFQLAVYSSSVDPESKKTIFIIYAHSYVNTRNSYESTAPIPSELKFTRAKFFILKNVSKFLKILISLYVRQPSLKIWPSKKLSKL